MKENDSNNIINEVTSSEYKYGFYTDIDMDTIPKGLNEDVVRLISQKKNSVRVIFHNWHNMYQALMN